MRPEQAGSIGRQEEEEKKKKKKKKNYEVR
jgi:hypothetical protein